MNWFRRNCHFLIYILFRLDSIYAISSAKIVCVYVCMPRNLFVFGFKTWILGDPFDYYSIVSIFFFIFFFIVNPFIVFIAQTHRPWECRITKHDIIIAVLYAHQSIRHIRVSLFISLVYFLYTKHIIHTPYTTTIYYCRSVRHTIAIKYIARRAANARARRYIY